MGSMLCRLELNNFNPHSRTGSDDEQTHASNLPWNFNPHSRTGSDENQLKHVTNSIYLNPHSRTGIYV